MSCKDEVGKYKLNLWKNKLHNFVERFNMYMVESYKVKIVHMED